MSDLRILLLLLLLNLVIVIVYVVWNVFRKGYHEITGKGKQSRSTIHKAVVMLLCPIVAAASFGFSWLLFRVFFHREVDLSDVVFSKDRINSLARADEEREVNIVPLEEAIAVTDKKRMRELMLNVVRGDIQQSLASIAGALNSEDSETSHYAASVLQGELNAFRSNVQRDYQMIMKMIEEERAAEQAQMEESMRDTRLEEDAAGLKLDRHSDVERVPSGRLIRDGQKSEETVDDVHFMGTLIEYMKNTIEKGVFTEIEQHRYTMMMDEVGELLYEREKDRIESRTLEALCVCLLRVKEYDKCQKWCTRSVELYPKILSTFTCRLKLYFSNGEREQFFRVLEELKQSDVVIDRETLELIRVFS